VLPKGFVAIGGKPCSASCNLAKGERGHRKKENMLEKHRKNVLQSKSIRKKSKA
jgi:hypothetical protein